MLTCTRPHHRMTATHTTTYAIVTMVLLVVVLLPRCST